MVHIERRPLSAIRRAAVYVNSEKRPLHEIVEEQQPDIALTAAYYDPGAWKPVCPVKAAGKVLFADPEYNYWAIAWDTGPDAAEALVPPCGACPSSFEQAAVRSDRTTSHPFRYFGIKWIYVM